MNSLIGPVPDGWQEVPLVSVCSVVAGPSSSMIRPVETGGVPIDIVAPKHLQHGRIAGSSTKAIAAIPTVVPAPSNVSLPAFPLMRRTSVHSLRDPAVMRANATSTPITIRLLSTGAYAAATNRRRALSSAVASAVSP